MVSNALSRRRHVFAAPSVCKPPPPRPPYPPVPPGCYCTVGGTYNPTTKKIAIGFSPWLPALPDVDPVEAWLQTTPALPIANPQTAANHRTTTTPPCDVPPGTPFVAIVVGYVFSSGRHCSAHNVVDTPGA